MSRNQDQNVLNDKVKTFQYQDQDNQQQELERRHASQTQQQQQQEQQRELINFGDEIFLKLENIGSMKFIHSDGFYPACIKCVDFSTIPADSTDIQGTIFEICHSNSISTDEFGMQSTSSNSSHKSILQDSIQNQSKTVSSSTKNSKATNQAGGGMVIHSQTNANSSERQTSSIGVQNGSILDHSKEKKTKEESGQSSDFTEHSSNLISEGDQENQVNDRGIPLTFYSKFVLRHKRSQKYLSLIEEDLEHFQLVLHSQPCLFTFSPCFKSQVVQTKTVCYQQFVYLEAVQASRSNTSRSIFLFQDNLRREDSKFNEKVLDQAKNLNRRHSQEPAISATSLSFQMTPSSGKFSHYSAFFGDFYFSPNQKSRFHVERYRSTSISLQETIDSSSKDFNEQTEESSMNSRISGEFVRFGDVVKLYHIEAESFLQYSEEQFSSNNNNNSNVPSSGFREESAAMTSNEELNQYPKQSACVFFSKSNNDVSLNEAYTLWQIINPLNVLDGGCVSWKQRIVLKCFNRNLYLQVNSSDVTMQINSTPIAHLSSKFINEEPQSYFHLCNESPVGQAITTTTKQGMVAVDAQSEGSSGNNNSLNNYVKLNSLFRVVHSDSRMTLSAKFMHDLTDLNPSITAGNEFSENHLKTPKRGLVENESHTIAAIPENQIIFKSEHCQGDVSKLYSVEIDEIVESNYVSSMLDLVNAAIPLILKYIRSAEESSKKSATNATTSNNEGSSNTNQSSNFGNAIHFSEFIQLLQSSIEHKIKFLLDIDSAEKLKINESIFRKHKVNSEKQDRAQKRGVLESSVNLLKAIWSHTNEDRIYEILKETKRLDEDEDDGNGNYSCQPTSNSFSNRRTSRMSAYRGRGDSKEEELIQNYRSFQSISRLVYFLIMTLCRNNGFNSIATFAYFTFFKNHLGYSIGATRTILQILKNNEKLLQLLHSKNYADLSSVKSTISRTLSLFKTTNFKSVLGGAGGGLTPSELSIKDVIKSASAKNKVSSDAAEGRMTLIHVFFKRYAQMFAQSSIYWTNFLEAMNIMCLCKEQALNINQLIIGNEVFAPTLVQSNRLFITLETINDQIFLTVLERKLELGEFVEKEESMKRNGDSKMSVSYQFLLKQLELFSNLCFERNYSNKAYLEKQITASSLIKYIKDEKFNTELRALLLGLLINLHFDSCPRSEIQRPNYTKTFIIPLMTAMSSNSYLNPQSVESSMYTSTHLTSQANRALQSTKRTVERSAAASNFNGESSSGSMDIEMTFSKGKNKKNNQNEIVSSSLRIQGDKPDANMSNGQSESFKSFLSKDSMEGIQELKMFVVDYLSRGIFVKGQMIKCDLLSLNVVRLSRLMIVFECFKSDEAEFVEVMKSLLWILASEKKSNLNEILKNVFKQDANSIREREVRDQVQLAFFREIFQVLLYYQQVEIDSNLTNLLEFYSLALSKASTDAALNECIKKDLNDYLPRTHNFHGSNSVIESNSYPITEAKNQQEKEVSSVSEVSHLKGFDDFLAEKNMNNKRNASVINSRSPSNVNQNRGEAAETQKKTNNNNNQTFFNILLKHFVSVGRQDFQTSHLILKLMFSSFSQRQNTIRSIKSLQLLSSKHEISVFNCLKSLATRLVIIAEMQELWFTGDSEYFQESAFGEVTELLLQLKLAFFADSQLSVDSNGGISFDSEQLSPQELQVKINNNNTDVRSSFERQSMVKNLRIYSSILSILAEGNILMPSVLKRFNKKGSSNIGAKWINQLYRDCFDVLYLFVQGNPTNQKIISRHFNAIVVNIRDGIDRGQFRLFAEIVNENRKISEAISPEFLAQYIRNLYQTSQKQKNQLVESRRTTKLNLHVNSFFVNLIVHRAQPSYENIDKLVKCLSETNSFYDFFNLVPSKTSNNESSSPSAQQKFSSVIQSGEFKFNTLNEKINKFEDYSCVEDLPFVYQRHVLETANYILKNQLDSTNLRYFFSKNISVTYAFELLSEPDLYEEVTDLSILFSSFKPVLMEFIRQVWLGNEKNSSKLNRNQSLIDFLNTETTKFTHLSSQRIIVFKQVMELNKNSKEKYQSLKAIAQSASAAETSQPVRGSVFISDQGIINEAEDEEEEEEQEEENNKSENKQKQKGKFQEQFPFQFMETSVLSLQSDFLVYTFKHLLPFILDTFKCFISFDSSSANLTSRDDYNAFVEFAREFAHFCSIEISKETFVVYASLMGPVLREFQEIFKEEINFSFDFEEELSEIETKKNSQKAEGLPQESGDLVSKRGQYDGNRMMELLDSRVYCVTNSREAYSQQIASISLCVLSSEYVRNEIVRVERSQLVLALREGSRSSSLSMQNILKRLVNFIKNSVEELDSDENASGESDESGCCDGVLVNTIRLLCDIIDSCNSEEERVYMQNFFNANGIVAVAAKFFCVKNSSNSEIDGLFEAFIELCIRLIEKSTQANQAIQESLFSSIIGTAPNSEVFFMNIDKRIKEEIRFVEFLNRNATNKISLEAKRLSFSYSIHEKFSITTLLRFIQLLVANSFEKFQKYLLIQHKSRNSYNILADLVNLLEAYIGGRNTWSSIDQSSFTTDAITCEKILMLMQTLILCIQGPNVDNQIELAESKFMDIMAYFLRQNDSFEQLINHLKKSASEKEQLNLTVTKVSENQQELFVNQLTSMQLAIIAKWRRTSFSYAQRIETLFLKGNPKHYGVWMLSQIKNKCISCLEQLTDGSNKTTTKRVLLMISPSILKINLAWIYDKYDALFEKEEYFDYELFELKGVSEVFLELLKNDSNKVLSSNLRQSLIIDSGFKMFKLLRFMLQQASSNEVEAVYNEIARYQAHILHKQSKKNIVYQVLGLLQDLWKVFASLYTFVKKTESLDKRLRKRQTLIQGTDQTAILDKMQVKAYKFFSKYTGQIEIVSGDRLERVLFLKYPHCFSLTNSLKYKVTNRINLYSPHSKLESIAEQASTFIERLKFEQLFKAKIDNSNMIMILANNLDLWKNLSYIVSILQNFMVILYQKRSKRESVLDFHFIGSNNEFQLICQFLQITLAALVFFFFMLKKVPLINKNVHDTIQLIESRKLSINEHSLKQNQSYSDYKTTLRNMKIKFTLFLEDGELRYFLIYFTLALIGMFNEFFLALLLFDIFFRFPVLLNIIYAVWRPRSQIILTMMVLIICTYIFSLMAFYFFYDRFEHECDNLITCFSVIFDYMYKKDAGFPSLFAPNGPEDFVKYYGLEYQLDWGSLWDFAYFFFIITLLFSIVSGIIIDTFGLFRDEEEEKKRNKKDFCLMCSIDRGTIDKLSSTSQGFQHHIDVEHNLWNYIFFISYLNEKEKNAFLGIEREIFAKQQAKDISWFPLNRSMSVNSNSDSNEELENIHKQIVLLESKFSNVLATLLRTSKTNSARVAKLDADSKQKQSILEKSISQIKSKEEGEELTTMTKSNVFKRSSSAVLQMKMSMNMQRFASTPIIEEEPDHQHDAIAQLVTSDNED